MRGGVRKSLLEFTLEIRANLDFGHDITLVSD